MDETYCKAGKMDPDHFASLLDPVRTGLIKIIRIYLLEGRQSRNYITAKLHKLNVYSMHSIFIRHQKLTHRPGKGSFFKSHIDTPRGEEMFGSLVVIFPTPHEGGALLLRHRGHEWMFDSGRDLAAERQLSIGYVAFFSDVEHEVTPVISGHRVTLTYNLYFDNGRDSEPSSKDPVSEPLSLPRAANENAFCEAFQGLLENPEFLPQGGTLAFGLRHIYPIDPLTRRPLEPIYGALKGSDAVVYQTVRALGFQPVLYLFYEWTTPNGFPEAAVIDNVIDFHGSRNDEVVDIIKSIRYKGGIVVCEEGWKIDPEKGYENPEKIEWVTPVTTFNRQKGTYAATYGNEPSVEVVYADLCLFVRIGKAGERLAYPTVSQLRKECERESQTSHFWYRWGDL